MQESKLLDATGNPVSSRPTQPLGDEVFWDKAAPTGPPQSQEEELPPHIRFIVDYYLKVAVDESLLLDVCLGQAARMIRKNSSSTTAGIDNLPDLTGGAFPTPLMFVASSIPLAIELYKQALVVLNGVRKTELEGVVAHANSLRKPQC